MPMIMQNSLLAGRADGGRGRIIPLGFANPVQGPTRRLLVYVVSKTRFAVNQLHCGTENATGERRKEHEYPKPVINRLD